MTAERFERAAIGNLVAAIATIIVSDVAFGLSYPLLNLRLEEAGTDAFLIGLNSAMTPLGIVLFGPFVPGLARRFGEKQMAFAALVTIAACLALFPLYPTYGAWIVIRFVLGIANVTLYSLSEAWVMQFAPDNVRGRVAAIYASVLALAFSLGPFMLPFTGIHGFLPFGIAIVVVMMSFVPLALITLQSDGHDDGDGNVFAFVKKAPLLVFAVGTMTLFDGVMLAFFPIFGLRNGLDVGTAAWALGVMIAGNVFLQYPIGWLADHWSRKGVIWCAAIVTPVLALLLPYAVTSWLIWPLAFFLGGGAYAVYTVALAVLGDNFRGQELIAGSTVFGAMWGVGGIIGPPIAGLALDRYGPDGISWVLAAFYVILIVGLLVTRGSLVRTA